MAIELQPRGAEAREVAGPIVRMRGVSFSHGALAVLTDIDLELAAEEVVAVVGPSGCGKTTLLELVCGLRAPTAGELRAAPAALMPQRDLLLPWMDALDNAVLALRLAGEERQRARERARPWFAEYGLAGFERARPHELSGGMRQRVAFLRTLLSGRPVLCLDEPFGALDAITRGQAQEWLAAALAHDPRAVLLVTHDVEEAVLLADRVLIYGPRPGRLQGELAVTLPRPRRPTDPAVGALRERALRVLRDWTGPAGVAPS
ncbi:MAG TPA: ABC transporter ATP-binding protein [Solirubrobacteraceae bacterium]|jgi:NitT/TauT family transport system ATP-binding protein|nr:ABC transporter ATP-binding protein [Solirubrobacteraceae bacterium]